MSETRLFHVSDLHFGKEDRGALDWFAAAVHAEKPDAVIVTGDLTMRARSREFTAAAAWLEGLGVPVTLEVGNHDLPYFNPIARVLHPYRRFRRIERALEKPLDLPGLWLVPLRTATRAAWGLDWSAGRVHSQELAAALDRLKARPVGTAALVACHHPLAGGGAHGRTRHGARALDALAAAGADAVLSGHIHDPFDKMVEAGGRTIRLIGAGTLSERTRGVPPSYNLLTLDYGRIAVEPRRFGG